jgi:chitodextrinase
MIDARYSLAVTLATVGLVLWTSACGEDQPPTWAPDSRLVESRVEGDSVTLSWPRAEDNGKIDGYQILMNGDVFEELPATKLSFELKELEQNTEYRFAVRAEDESGNLSPPLELKITTADRTAPVWPEGAQLTLEEAPAVPKIPPCAQLEPTQLLPTIGLTFRWPAAADDRSVHAYRIKKGSTVVVRTTGDKTSHQLITAAPNGTYSIEAGDAAGNWSTHLEVTRVGPAVDAGKVGELGIPGLLEVGDTKLDSLFTDKLDTDPGPAAGLGALLEPGQPVPGFDLAGKLEPPATLELPGPALPLGDAPGGQAPDPPSDTPAPVR